MTTTAQPTTQSENPYLRGNWAPVQNEVTATDLEVTGSIPEFLDGRYLRIGPNPIEVPDPQRYHVFLGEGMVHGLRLRDGNAHWYRNRWVRSADVARRFGEQWPGGPHDGGFDFASNTNVIGHAGKTLALTEAGVRPYELTEELDTVGTSNFCGTLFAGYTAHPKRDPVTGELHAVSYNPMRGSLVQYTVTGVDGRVRHAVDVKLDDQTMVHDFSLTEKYVVIYDLPVVLNLTGPSSRPGKAVARWLTQFASHHAAPDFMIRTAMRASERSGPPRLGGFPYSWAPGRRARVGLLPRTGTAADVRWFEVNPCYVFHPLNAFDENGPDGEKVVLDVVRYDSVFVDTMELSESRTLDRWTVDLTTGRVREERLDDHPQEFPRVDERRVGLRHRYGYTVGYEPDTEGITVPNAILRHDMVTGSPKVVGFGQGREPGEFVFVPSAPDADEDDGVIMGFVYDRAADRSDLVLLDGQTLETVATVHLPARVPNGFHGNWVPTSG